MSWFALSALCTLSLATNFVLYRLLRAYHKHSPRAKDLEETVKHQASRINGLATTVAQLESTVAGLSDNLVLLMVVHVLYEIDSSYRAIHGHDMPEIALYREAIGTIMDNCPQKYKQEMLKAMDMDNNDRLRIDGIGYFRQTKEECEIATRAKPLSQ